MYIFVLDVTCCLFKNYRISIVTSGVYSILSFYKKNLLLQFYDGKLHVNPYWIIRFAIYERPFILSGFD